VANQTMADLVRKATKQASGGDVKAPTVSIGSSESLVANSSSGDK
jgi:hypothetical protein